ncbi:MAG: hypothetical protein NC307_12750 [Roseburia sp.]|nr:hypothetical protein [Roseburia sp.]
MIINSSDVTMTSQRKYQSSTLYASSGMSWGTSGIQNQNLAYIEDYTEESEDGKSSGREPDSGEELMQQFKQAKSIGKYTLQSPQQSLASAIRQQSINYLFMLLFGGSNLKKFSLFDYLGSTFGGNNWVGQRSGGSYMETYNYTETETTKFSTTGTVKTADGREINFNLSLSMSRSFEEAYTGSVEYGTPLNQTLNQAANMCDPLVINLNTTAASVSDQSFYFDLDADGQMDKISNLSSGSGFLALDKNGDGKINDGKELFGTASGDGFGDLAAYDKDGNGWIDENDEIFSKLRIWTKDERGKDVLYTLKQAGVGAICLKHASTDFALKSYEDNSTNALVRQTGVFLYENGKAGTVQHLDLAKKNA